MRRYITERHNGEYRTKEIKWNYTDHYNLTTCFDTELDAVDYVLELNSLINYYSNK